MKIIGIDLSGPANSADTCLVCFQEQVDRLSLVNTLPDANDQQIFEAISLLTRDDQVIIGIDAPLSYNIGGGDRPADKDLRKHVIQMGMPPGAVMPPTLTKMVYLTLRGISLSRSLETVQLDHELRIVEVHPGATLALRKAPIDDVRQFKKNEACQMNLLRWLETQGLQNVCSVSGCTDHYVAGCASALAAWKWYHNEAIWCVRARPPFHVHDFAC